MATLYGTNMTSILSSPPSDGTKLDASQVNPKLRVFVEQVDLATNDVDSGDDVYVARLPANSRLLKVEVYANASSNLAVNSATASVGNSSSDTAYSAAIALGAAGSVTTLQGDSVGDEITAETDILLAIAAGDLPNASGDGMTVVTYYVDLN